MEGAWWEGRGRLAGCLMPVLMLAETSLFEPALQMPTH